MSAELDEVLLLLFRLDFPYKLSTYAFSFSGFFFWAGLNCPFFFFFWLWMLDLGLCAITGTDASF